MMDKKRTNVAFYFLISFHSEIFTGLKKKIESWNAWNSCDFLILSGYCLFSWGQIEAIWWLISAVGAYNGNKTTLLYRLLLYIW